MGPGKHLLHIAHRFGRILYCVHSTQYNILVCLVVFPSQLCPKRRQFMVHALLCELS